MEKLIEKVTNILGSNNYKITSQRKDILKVLIKNKERHFSAEELYEEVKKINPDVGLATIYRNLEIFSELGITHQLDFDGNFKKYELSLERHHHHLICKNCGKIIEFNDDVLEDFEKDLEKHYNFKIVDHQIKFYGICQDCKNEDE
ncbi:Fur family transcriptional regulator [Halothermothrix orenii]|uniref:Ferric uptake regulator, Fur family n=1 Tax=Halothermothrix orenii (strain H 168 / OCM 544 / DSM 9562) TaxID=373903 RepID=B8D2C0_HALOH|nr:Fur family transcriptional regulator [Halothermothrix orenii]ACL69347.1 ferric uptake regulator, Fur family [Halothermothrix orenii H 168]